MMKPEPSDCASRVCGCPGRPNRLPNGVPAKGFWTSTCWRVEILTTARSEEHTSELQSLMRISYAVFCLKKKKNTTPHIHRLKVWTPNNTHKQQTYRRNYERQ